MIVSGFAATTTAGAVGTVTVTLKDPYGNIATGYVGTAHFTSSDPKAVLPANYTFTAADARIGKVTFKVIANLVGARDALPADNEGNRSADVGIHIDWHCCSLSPAARRTERVVAG
jgi:hypothetical protein